MLHRKMLCAFSAMVYAEQGKKWMDKLCDAIWTVCDEFTWVLPAHLLEHQTTPETMTTGRVDLFAAELLRQYTKGEIDFFKNEKAYEVPELEKLSRRFEVFDDKLVIEETAVEMLI